MYANLGGFFAPDDTEDDEVFDYSEDGLGIALPAIGAVLSSVFGGNPKDANRIATNTAAYNQAVSGNDGAFQGYASALEFLRVHAVAGDADGGWATAAATNDANVKYQRALAAINAQRGASTGTPVQSGGITAATVGGLSVPPLVLAGAAAVGIFMLSKNRRRR